MATAYPPRMPKFFLDTEFIETPPTIDLISIGIVSEDEREFYAVSNEFNETRASPWVQANVLPKLPPRTDPAWMSRAEIAAGILRFVEAGGGEPSFVGYFADYDWVLLCWLFGKMIDLPKGWPMYCLDLKQEMAARGIKREDLPLFGREDAHNALADALWTKHAWYHVMKQPRRS